MMDVLNNIWALLSDFIMTIYNWICANLVPTFGIAGTIIILIIVLMILRR